MPNAAAEVPIAKPWTGSEELELVGQVLESGMLTQGPMIERFEAMVSARVGGNPAIAVSSGTAALHLAIRVAGLRPGDEVVLPSYTFVATANSVLYEGCVPVFADIDPLTYNLSASLVERAITPKTQAIVVVDQFGLCSDLSEISELARRKGLVLIEDAACALGARYRERPVGSWPHLTTFSFHPRKAATTGEGGVVVTSDPGLERRLRALRSHGQAATGSTEYLELGFNYRLSDVLAAIGVAQLGKLDRMIQERRARAARYRSELAGLGWISPPEEPAGSFHVYQSYSARVSDPERRDRLLQRLKNAGIHSRPGIPPAHRIPHLRARAAEENSLPETDRASRESILLPLYAGMADQDQSRVIEAIRRFE